MADGTGGNKSFSVLPGDNLTIDAFGSFGTGAVPSTAAAAELDTVVFQGAGLTARNMLLAQVGADVVVTFDGVTNTRVTLTNTTIERLENITALGNFQFD